MKKKLFASALAATMMITGAPAVFAAEPTAEDYQNRPDETWEWRCDVVLTGDMSKDVSAPEEDCYWFQESDEFDILGSATDSMRNDGATGTAARSSMSILYTVVESITSLFRGAIGAIFIAVAAQLSSTIHGNIN